MNKQRLYWTLQLSGWTSFVLLQMILRAFTAEVTTNQAIFFTIEGIIFLSITHYFRYFIKKRNWLKLAMFRVIPRLILSVISLAVLLYFIRLAASYPLGLYRGNAAWSPVNIIALSSTYALILFIWMVLYFAYHYFINYNLALKQEAAIKEIELNNLKSQLNPHFIFNSLNVIRALVDENPKNSKQAITRLSNILRNSLVSNQKRVTGFAEELNLVKDYLGLEAIRYEERLRVTYSIDKNSNDYLVPPMMIQTLVENAVKHGIARLKKGGEISLETIAKQDRLIVIIRNSGHFSPKSSSSGTGLGVENTKRRLKMIYEGKAKFEIKNDEIGQVLTYLEIPKSSQL